MYGGTGVKTIVYNTKNDSKEGQKKKTRKKERESKQKVEEIQQ